MDDFYASNLYSEAQNYAKNCAGGDAFMTFIYMQTWEDGEFRHYFIGSYNGPEVELTPSAAAESYELSHSALMSYDDEEFEGHYMVTVVHLGANDGTIRVNVHSLQGVGEEIHGVISEELEAVRDGASFGLDEMYFADAVVNLMADAEGEGE